MSGEVVAAIVAAGVTVLASVGSSIYTAGATVGRVKDQEKLLEKQNLRLDGHDITLSLHGERIAKGEAWREGYRAGKGDRPT